MVIYTKCGFSHMKVLALNGEEKVSIIHDYSLYETRKMDIKNKI